MKALKKRTGIFGGTFNPVHKGHVSAAKSFLASGLIEELWVLLNPSPPHKSGETFVPYATRLKMLEKAFAAVEHSRISDIETELPSPNYTLQTLKYLTENHPDRTFFLCIGKDSFLSFKKWHRWNKILDYCELLVAERPIKGQIEQDQELMKHAQYIDHEPMDVSSTDIRTRWAEGQEIKGLVPPGVFKIIKDQQLYL